MTDREKIILILFIVGILLTPSSIGVRFIPHFIMEKNQSVLNIGDHCLKDNNIVLYDGTIATFPYGISVINKSFTSYKNSYKYSKNILKVNGNQFDFTEVDTRIPVKPLMDRTISNEIVTIYRDVYGVPHIYADTNEGVMYGFGYAQAEDHLEAMILKFIKANGKLSEFFGKKYLFSDIEMNLCKIREMAEERYMEIDPQVRSMLEAFAAGINKYIAENVNNVSHWVLKAAPITGIDIVALGRYDSCSMDLKLAFDELQGITRTHSQSNEWVIDETKTANGYVMLQADPHLGWGVDSRFYEAHLVGGDFNISGGTNYGMPVIGIGHTDTFGVAITSNSPDTADIYIETLNKNNTQYLFNGRWYDIINEPVTINILNAAPVKIPRYYTHNGERIILYWNLTTHKAYSARLVSMNEINYLTQAFKLNTARNLTELKQGFSNLNCTTGNIAYGDIYGNIYYLYYARQPLKSLDYDWTLPVDGSIKDTEWRDLIPFEDLPQIENPASHYLINNNVDPWYVTENNSINPEDYPPYLFHKKPDMSGGFGYGIRQLRAMSFISPDPSLTFEEMKNIAFDNYLLVAEWIKPLIKASVNDSMARQYVTEPFSQLIDPAFQILDKWNNYAVKNSTGITLFSILYDNIPLTFGPNFIPNPDNLTLRDKITILWALALAANWIYQTYGRLDVPWGDVHKIKRGIQEFSVNGSNKKDQALRLTSVEDFENGTGYCNQGSSYMMLMVFSNPIKAFSSKPYGQSEDPNSSHFADLTELYCNDQFKPAWFTLDDVLNNLESMKILMYMNLNKT